MFITYDPIKRKNQQIYEVLFLFMLSVIVPNRRKAPENGYNQHVVWLKSDFFGVDVFDTEQYGMPTFHYLKIIFAVERFHPIFQF